MAWIRTSEYWINTDTLMYIHDWVSDDGPTLVLNFTRPLTPVPEQLFLDSADRDLVLAWLHAQVPPHHNY